MTSLDDLPSASKINNLMQCTRWLSNSLECNPNQYEWERGRGKAPICSQSVPNVLLPAFNSGNTSIYRPLSKTSRYGPVAPFLRTCGRSVIQARTIRTRIPTTINGCKNVRAFKNDLRTVCPSRSDGPRYIKLSQNKVLLTLHICWNLYCGRSAPEPWTVRNTKYLYCGRSTLRPRTVRSSKKKTKTKLLKFCPNTSPSTTDGPPPGTNGPQYKNFTKHRNSAFLPITSS